MRVNDSVVVAPYGEGTFWGHTGNGNGLVHFEMGQVSQWKLGNGQWPVGRQYNSPSAKFILILEVSLTLIKEKSDEKPVRVSTHSADPDVSVSERRLRSRKPSGKRAGSRG